MKEQRKKQVEKISGIGLILLSLVSGICFTLSDVVLATTIVDFTFEDDVVGSMPLGWSEASKYDGHEVIVHVTDTTTGDGIKSLYMNDWAWVSQLVVVTTFPYQFSGIFRLTGMACAEQTSEMINPFGLTGPSNGRFNEVLFWPDGTFWYVDGHANYLPTQVSYQTGQWYFFDFLINMDKKRWSFIIEDTLGNELFSADNLRFGSPPIYTQAFYVIRSWGVGYSGTGQWYIDNIRLELIEMITVEIDIKPGSCPNPFNGKNKGGMPVAIVGTDTLDVTAIDPTTIELTTPSGFVVPALDEWEIKDTTQPYGDNTDCYTCFDADDPANFNCDLDPDIPGDDAYCGDGKPDLVVKFDTQALADAIGEVDREACIELLLMGLTQDGVLIYGSDKIVIKTKIKD